MSADDAAQRKLRAEFAAIAQDVSKWVWIVDEVDAFVPAKVLTEHADGSKEVEIQRTHEIKTVKKADIGPYITRVAELKNHVDDMVRMGDVNEATILHNLRARFVEDVVYTNIGSILVSINPFTWIPGLYSSELIEEHLNLPPGEISTPHVFQIAAAAFHGLRNEQANQAIIISGESGAGKTEATKKCLQFFAEAAGSAEKSSGMDGKLLSANPILEAFGNAKTVRNNNSSRFGKWMEVHFNVRAQICGSQIINYLLEKSRVVFQAPNERNYHIFYMLCVALPAEQRAKFALGPADNYNFVNKSGCIVVDGLNDVHEFKDLMAAFKELEFNDADIETLFTMVAGLLHLSNVTFDAIDADTCRMSGSADVRAELGHAATLLGVTPEALQLALEQKLIETRNERVRSPLSVEKAVDGRNSMAKAIYGRQFDWLVQKVNSSMEGALSDSKNVIGVLDIFGFEIFEINSFEQLCINYCNEKLQQHFNTHVFKAEENCYKEQGITYDEVKFIDNQDVLDLVELRPNGLLPKLDDEIKVPKGSDAGYLDKIIKMHGENPRFLARVRRGNVSREHEFGVNHYAGAVYYDVRGFLEKNKDELLLNLRELLQGSTHAFIQMLFNEETNPSTILAAKAAEASGAAKSAGGGAGGKGDKLSQGFQFRTQLDALMKTLNATAPHYIRCIKPNSIKKARVFEATICLQQLRYAGVFEAVKIRQQGYPFRWSYEHFYKRYRCIGFDRIFNGKGCKVPPPGMDYIAATKRLLADIVQTAKDVQGEAVQVLHSIDVFKMGKTMVLYRADPHRIIEAYRDLKRDRSALAIERVYRGHKARKYARVLRGVRDRIRAAIAARDLALVEPALAEGAAQPVQLFEMKELTRLHKRLLEEKACRDALVALSAFDPVDKYAEYEAALKEAARLGLTDPVVTAVATKFATVKDRIETKQNLLRGIEIGDRALIERSLARADELKAEWGDVIPADVRERAAATLQVIARETQLQDDLKRALSRGGPTGAVGSLDLSVMDTAELDAVIADAQSGRVPVATIVGRNLIATAQAMRALRAALRAGDWPAIEAGVSAAVALRDAGTLAPESEAEVKQAQGEISDKRIQRAVASALTSGAPRGRVGELDLKSADIAGLRAAIDDARRKAEEVGGFSPPTMHVIACAELVLRLRQALVSGDWGSIKKAVTEALEVPRLPEVAVAEVTLAKDELDNHTLVHQLTDALERGSPSGTVARLDLSGVDVALLSERIAHAEEVGPKTAQAGALLKLARIVRKVRQELLAGNLAVLPDLTRLAAAIPKEFVPAHVTDELLVAQYEGENVLITRGLRDAIEAGGVSGVVGNTNRGAVATASLEAALKKAAALKCRSDEASWLYQVTQALLEARTAFKDGRWDALKDLVLVVSGFDGGRPMRGAAGAGTPGSAAPAPMLRERGMSMMMRGRTPSADPSLAGVLPAGHPSAHGHAGHGHAPMLPLPERSRSGSVASRGAAGGSPGDGGAGGATHRRSVDGGGDGEGGVGFSLPLPVKAELSLMSEELNNVMVIKALTIALATGGPAGPLGELNGAQVDSAGLEAAIKRAERSGVATPQAASLLYTARVIRDLREGLRSGDWDRAVEGVLRTVAANNASVVRFATAGTPQAAAAAGVTSVATSTLGRVEVPPYTDDPALLEQAALTLAEAGLPEVVRVEQESRYRAVVAQMVAALSTGGASGKVGALVTATVTVAGLAAAIDASRSLGARTDKSRHLTSLCRLMWQMRTAVREGDWPAVESLVGAAGEVLGRSAPLPPTCAVPAATLGEVDLYRSQAHNLRLVAVLGRALGQGGPVGEVGRLNLTAMSVGPLEEALRLALALTPVTAEARRLTSTALHLRSMRLALLGGNWDRLGELLDYAHNAAGGKTAAPSAPSAVADPLAPPAGLPSSNTRDGRGAPAAWPGVFDPSSGFDIGADGIDAGGLGEVATMQLELNNRNIIVQITAALARGCAGGTTGHLDTAPIETGPLEWAIDYAQRIGCATPEARQLLATAVIVRRIRLALLAGDWGKLESALLEAHGKVLADIGAPEIRSAQDELDNRAVLAELAAALSRGKPQGRTGRLYTGSIDMKPLNDAIGLAGRLVPKTVEAKQMLFTAKVVARLRLCLLNEDLAEAGLTLEAIRGKMLASVAMPEVRSVQDEVDNWTLVNELSAAMTSGRSAGGPGALDVSSCDAGRLERAIDHADELGVKTTEASNLLASAQLLFRLRVALLADRWTPAATDPDGVEAVLRDAAAAPVSELAAPELALARAELDNRRLVLGLSTALSRGGARGPVGSLDVSGVDTAELDGAITDATDTGVRTDEADRLLTAAKLIRRLRAVLLAGNWQWVGSVLLEARSLKHVFPSVSLRELQLAQDELDNRAILAQVSAALKAGALAGPVGAPDFGALDVAVLDDALGYAKALGVKSDAAATLVSTASFVRRLRAALKAGAWAEAAELLASAAGAQPPLAAVAADELALARACVDDHGVRGDLSSALAVGGPAGQPLGELPAGVVTVDRLDAAIATAMKAGAATPDARRSLVSALLVRRLRGALLDGDYAAMAGVVSEADREVASLTPPAVAEVDWAKRTLEFRDAMAQLSAALGANTEPELVAAAGRASALRLAEHPRPSVRETVEAVHLALGRLSRTKSGLQAALKAMDGPALADALAQAAASGYAHPLVDEAKRALTVVQGLADRAAAALRSCDALGLHSVLREAEGAGVSLPSLGDVRRLLSSPRVEFLRRELSAVLATLPVGGGGQQQLPGGDVRSPTPGELAVVHCTLQLKDLFFADVPDVAPLLDGSGAASATQASTTAAGGANATVSNVSTYALLASPAASSAAAALKAQRNMEDNVRGTAARGAPIPALQGSAWALGPGSAAGAVATAAFRPGGPGVPAPAGTIGGVVPPPHSRLRRQFELGRYPRLKPPHMFSRKFAPTDAAPGGDSPMLRWQVEPLHTSLTLLADPNHRRLAVRAFRDILAFMGDRPQAKPLALAADLLATGVAVPDLRDELLLQLAKQLTGNPSVASAERGWVLLHAALAAFPPSEELENHLELWLRERGAVPCVWAMHLTLYRGGPGGGVPPGVADVQASLERARAPPLPSLVVPGGDDAIVGGAADEGVDYQAELARQMRAVPADTANAPVRLASVSGASPAQAQRAPSTASLAAAVSARQANLPPAAAPAAAKPAPSSTGDRELDAVLAGAAVDIEARMAAIARKLNEY